MIDYGTSLIVHKKQFDKTSIESSQDLENLEIGDGQVLLQIESFAYTANNVTYALVGDQIGYWNFFPTTKEDYGIIPCWGFANVAKSNCEDIEIGARYYGFYPMASHLKITPGHISSRGMTDMAAHRQALPVIYNQMINCNKDPLYKKELEDLQSLIRPLFTTSFLIHDQYVLNDYYDADQIIIISASSKTGLSLASCLAKEAKKVVALTSAKNVEMVTNTGYYDTVITYDELDKVPIKKSAIVDFAGNHSIQLKLQNHLNGQLKKVTMVGMVRWEESKDKDPLPMKPEFFFAPTYAAKRIKVMGPEEFGLKLSKKYLEFLQHAKDWINLKYFKGGDDLKNLHLNMLSGNFDARDGNIVSF